MFESNQIVVSILDKIGRKNLNKEGFLTDREQLAQLLFFIFEIFLLCWLPKVLDTFSFCKAGTPKTLSQFVVSSLSWCSSFLRFFSSKHGEAFNHFFGHFAISSNGDCLFFLLRHCLSLCLEPLYGIRCSLSWNLIRLNELSLPHIFHMQCKNYILLRDHYHKD